MGIVSKDEYNFVLWIKFVYSLSLDKYRLDIYIKELLSIDGDFSGVI